MKSEREQITSYIEDCRQRGWVNMPDPIQTEKGKWVLREVSILTYDPNRPKPRKNAVPYTANFKKQAARQEMERLGIEHYNLYRCGIENGRPSWRSDW